MAIIHQNGRRSDRDIWQQRGENKTGHARPRKATLATQPLMASKLSMITSRMPSCHGIEKLISSSSSDDSAVNVASHLYVGLLSLTVTICLRPNPRRDETRRRMNCMSRLVWRCGIGFTRSVNAHSCSLLVSIEN